jgi:hypothetical protein
MNQELAHTLREFENCLLIPEIVYIIKLIRPKLNFLQAYQKSKRSPSFRS